MKNLIALALISLSLIACNNTKTEEVKTTCTLDPSVPEELRLTIRKAKVIDSIKEEAQMTQAGYSTVSLVSSLVDQNQCEEATIVAKAYIETVKPLHVQAETVIEKFGPKTAKLLGWKTLSEIK